MGLPIVGALALAALGLVWARRRDRGEERDSSRALAPIFPPYQVPTRAAPEVPSSIQEHTVEEGVEWLERRRQELLSRGVKPQAYTGQSPNAYELWLLSCLKSSRYTCSKSLKELIPLAVCDSKKLALIFPLVDKICREDVDALRTLASHYGSANRARERDFMEARLARRADKQMREAIKRVDEALNLFPWTEFERGRVKELFLTPAGVLYLREFLGACEQRQADRLYLLAALVLRPLLLDLLLDGFGASLGNRAVSLSHRALNGLEGTHGRELQAYTQPLERAALQAGLEPDTLQLKQCRRCQKNFIELKTGTCCWGCWGN